MCILFSSIALSLLIENCKVCLSSCILINSVSALLNQTNGHLAQHPIFDPETRRFCSGRTYEPVHFLCSILLVLFPILLVYVYRSVVHSFIQQPYLIWLLPVFDWLLPIFDLAFTFSSGNMFQKLHQLLHEVESRVIYLEVLFLLFLVSSSPSIVRLLCAFCDTTVSHSRVTEVTP